MADRQVPSVPPNLDPQLRNYLSAVREVLNGIPSTLKSLSSTVTEVANKTTSLDANTLKALLPSVSPYIAWILNTETPPKPTGLTATGLFNTIFLHWDYPEAFTNYNFAEIYRANALDGSGHLIPIDSIDFARDAKLISTSDGNIYSDPVEPGSKYYYWVRFVSMANVAGPYFQSNGILGETTKDLNTVLTDKGWQIGVDKLIATTAWIKSADIDFAQITSAKIANTLQSDNYVPGQSGWFLSRTGGELIVNQLTVTDGAGNVIMSSGGRVPWAFINGKPNTLAQLDSIAATALTNAQDHATAAINRLDDIVSDSVLSPEEKKDVLKEWTAQLSDSATVVAQAAKYTNPATNHPDNVSAVSTALSTYQAKGQALADYLNGGTTYTGGTPLWISTDATNGLLANTNIVGATFRAKFADYYNAKTALLKAISDSAHAAYIGYNLYGQITVENASTYIADLAVNTLQIGDQAVTFPMGLSIRSYTLPFTYGQTPGTGILQPEAWAAIPGAALVVPPTNPTSLSRGPVLIELTVGGNPTKSQLQNALDKPPAFAITQPSVRVLIDGAPILRANDRNIIYGLSSGAFTLTLETSACAISETHPVMDHIVLTVIELKK